MVYFTSAFMDSRSRTLFARAFFSRRFSFSCLCSDFTESFVLPRDSNYEKVNLINKSGNAISIMHGIISLPLEFCFSVMVCLFILFN